MTATSPLVKEWADAILDTFGDVIAEVDLPYVRAPLEAAGEFEKPLPDLKVNIIDAGTRYDITVRGYQKIMDDVDWPNAFRGIDRDAMMAHVGKVGTVSNDPSVGITKLIQVEKMKFTSSKGHRKTGKGDYDDDDDQRASSKQRSRDKRSRWD